MRYEEDKYIGYDGTRMFMATWLPDDERPRALMLAIHGLGSHAGGVKNVGEFMAERGIAVFAPDMRGAGHYSGRKGHVMRFTEFVEDIENLVMQIKDRYLNKLTFIYGASFGGLQTVHYLLTYPRHIDGVILMGPAVSETLEVGMATRLIGRIGSALNIKKYISNAVPLEFLSHDPEIAAAYKTDPLRFELVTMRYGMEGLSALKEANKRAASFTHPVLIQQAGDDRLVSPEKNKEFFDKLGSTDKEWILYEGFYHELYSEVEKERVLTDAYSWLDKRLPS
jgi:alpha-beta hydrolase superfamily lysophospholipase